MKHAVNVRVVALVFAVTSVGCIGEIRGQSLDAGTTRTDSGSAQDSGGGASGGGGGASGGGGGASGGGGGASGGGGGGGGGATGGGGGASGGGGGASGGGGGSTTAAFQPGSMGCQPQTLEAALNLNNYVVDRYGWSDANCQRRSAALVRNNTADPGGSRGGFLREFTWRNGSTTVTARGTGSNGWQGWGYVVNHYGGSADLSTNKTGTFQTLLALPHHALHEFKLRMSPGGPVGVTIHWFFATGRSAPVFAITFDASPAGSNVINADTRTPYGDLAFEGTPGAIGGLGWGDRYRFVTTSTGPVTQSTSWDYTQPNTVPYAHLWAQTLDAEMGSVQTQTFDQHVAGGDYGGGQLAANCQGKTSANRGAQCANGGETMPMDWLWPFQLNQYELPFTTGSHRLAWGSNYGAIGKSSVSAFGKTLSGYPKVSYSVFMVIGPHSAQPTLDLAEQVDRLSRATLTASEGAVKTSGPAGVGRTDTLTYSPAGYSPVFATWELSALSNRVTATLSPSGGPLQAPVFHVSGLTAAPTAVTLNGTALPASQCFLSYDAARGEAWLTLHGTVASPVTLHIE
jgi:hypothetical protein